jgi:hypothetical protein
MPRFKVSETLPINFELTGDFTGMIIPFLGRSEADAKPRVVLGVVEIYYLSQNRLLLDLVYG